MSDTIYSDNVTLLIKKIEAAVAIVTYDDINTEPCDYLPDTYKAACEFLTHHFKKLDAKDGY